MEELNIEELKNRRAVIRETLEKNAAYLNEAHALLESSKTGSRRNSIIMYIIALLTNIGFSITCFDLGESQFTDILGWVFAAMAIILGAILLVVVIGLVFTSKSIDKFTNINIELEKELKEINDKLTEYLSTHISAQKVRRSRKQKTQEVNE